MKEKYVSFGVANIMKELGFNEMCGSEYYTSVRHNGREISFDEELDLKGEGRGDEIEYVEGGAIWDEWNCNRDNSEGVYSRPTIQMAWEWFLMNHHIEIRPYLTSCGWCFEINDTRELDITGAKPIYRNEIPSKKDTYRTYDKAIEAAIKWYVKNKVN